MLTTRAYTCLEYYTGILHLPPILTSHTLLVGDAGSLQQLSQLSPSAGSTKVASVAFFPGKGNIIVSGDDSGGVVVWNVSGAWGCVRCRVRR